MKKKFFAMMTLVITITIVLSTNAFALDFPNPVEVIKEKVEETFPAKLHEEFETSDGKWSVTVDETDKGEFEVKVTSKSRWEVVDTKGGKLSDAKRVKMSWTQTDYNNRIREELEAFSITLR